MNEKSVPPGNDEIEISVFGPGFGECIVVHLGNGEWMIVDSCIDATTRNPVALDYLNLIGVSVDKVKFVIATHWHDDHVKGIGKVYEACKNARFACSLALNSIEWTSLLKIYKGYVNPCSSGVDEMQAVMQELEKRKAKGGYSAPDFCIRQRTIFNRNYPLPARVECLAPSDAAVGLMQARFGEQMPKAKGRRLRLPDLNRNDCSVVLLVQVGPTSILLGADLECDRTPGLGWQVILDEYPIPESRFCGMKIPHHGSKTGHHPNLWSHLMKSTAWGVVTPFNRLKDPLPTEKDCSRIARATNDAYLTAPPGLEKFKHSNPAVQKTVSETTQSIKSAPGKQGHVRFRKSASHATWNVELFGSALALKEYHR